MESRAFLGESVDDLVRVGEAVLRNRSNAAQSIREGTTVSVKVDPDAITMIRT